MQFQQRRIPGSRATAHDRFACRLGACRHGSRAIRAILCHRPSPRAPVEQRTEDAAGHEQDDHDQYRADRSPAREHVVARSRGVADDGDDGRADRGSCPVTRAAEHTHQHHRERYDDRECFARGDIGHEQRLYAAGNTGERRRDRQRRELVAEGRHAEDLGDILVVANRKEPCPQARPVDPPCDPHRRRGGDKSHQIERRRRRRPKRRHGNATQINAWAAIDWRAHDDRRQNEGDRQRQQREQFAAHLPDPENDAAQRNAHPCCDQRGGGQRSEKRPPEAPGEGRGRVHPEPEERAVAEGKIPRIAGENIPRRRQDDPVEHEIQKRLVERRQADERDCEQQRATRKQRAHLCAAVTGRHGQAEPR